jgi:XTP/dITP diphosphohydrolase
VFHPDGIATSSAELTADEKNAVSHRSRAFGALLEQLRELYG